MKRYGFLEKDVDPSDVYVHLRQLLTADGFHVDSESSQADLWDLRASKRGTARIVLGAVRDADVVVAGTRGKFEVQFNLGIWGKDLAVPAVEGVPTLGLATAVDLHEARMLENKIWKSIVHMIDPKLQICKLCGFIFKSAEDLEAHQQAASDQSEEMGSGWRTMLPMPMLWV